MRFLSSFFVYHVRSGGSSSAALKPVCILRENLPQVNPESPLLIAGKSVVTIKEVKRWKCIQDEGRRKVYVQEMEQVFLQKNNGSNVDRNNGVPGIM